jgi:hypothetical protein
MIIILSISTINLVFVLLVNFYLVYNVINIAS